MRLFCVFIFILVRRKVQAQQQNLQESTRSHCTSEPRLNDTETPPQRRRFSQRRPTHSQSQRKTNTFHDVPTSNYNHVSDNENDIDRLRTFSSSKGGGKRVDHTKAGSYDSRTAMSSVHLNSDYYGISTFQEFKYGKALPETVKIENKRKRKVKANAIRAEENKKRRKVDDASSKTKEKGYASGGVEL